MTPYLEDGDLRLYLGDSREVMAGLEPETFDAIVTSPPYADQRKYGGAKPEDYGEWIAPFLAAALPLVKPGGGLMLNIGRVVRNGEEKGCAEEARRRAQEAGWRWIDTIIWHKPNALPWSSTAYLHSVHEYVYWLAAPGAPPYRGFDAETRTPHAPDTITRSAQGYRRTTDERYHKRGKVIAPPHPDGARPKTIVTYAVGTERGIDHPAPMSLPLARHLVSLSCPRGGLVIDPFAGAGTTCFAARERGRRSVGIDINADYLDEAIRRTRVLAVGA